jgi:hypothetical protein
MSEFNVFTVLQLKQIINATGISQFIKLNVNKPQLIQQISKYIEFDGYNFRLKSTNNQKFLQSDLLKKEHKPKISSKDKKILEMTKKEIKNFKEIINNHSNKIDEKINLLKQQLTNLIEEEQKQEQKEIYPKKIIKKINIKKAKKDFNKLIEEEVTPKYKKLFLKDWLEIKIPSNDEYANELFDMIDNAYEKEKIKKEIDNIKIPYSVYESIKDWFDKKIEQGINPEYTDFVTKVIYPRLLQVVDKNTNKLILMFKANDIGSDSMFKWAYTDKNNQLDKKKVLNTFIQRKKPIGVRSELERQNPEFKKRLNDIMNIVDK